MGQISNQFTQIRKTIEFHRRSSEEKRSVGDHYRLDRNYMHEYFDIHKEWEDKIRVYIESLVKAKNKIICVDVCGRTTGKSFGADQTYCFSLKASEFSKQLNKDRVYFDGDIFNGGDFQKFLKVIKKGKAAPALITFEPVAGLQGHGPTHQVDNAPEYASITYTILGKRLKQAIEILRPGGYIYLERPFQFDADDFGDWYAGVPVHKHQLALRVRSITRKLHCTTEIRKVLGGLYFLIRKSK